MSNNTVLPTPATNAAAGLQSRINAANASITQSYAALAGSIRRYQLYDYAFQPNHPQNWTTVISRDLEEADMFEAQNWLRQMAGGAYDTVTHYTPALRLLAYFERPQDAAMFKLVWN